MRAVRNPSHRVNRAWIGRPMTFWSVFSEWKCGHRANRWSSIVHLVSLMWHVHRFASYFATAPLWSVSFTSRPTSLATLFDMYFNSFSFLFASLFVLRVEPLFINYMENQQSCGRRFIYGIYFLLQRLCEIIIAGGAVLCERDAHRLGEWFNCLKIHCICDSMPTPNPGQKPFVFFFAPSQILCFLTRIQHVPYNSPERNVNNNTT